MRENQKLKIKNKKFKPILSLGFIFHFSFFIFHFSCYAQSVKSADLIANAKDYDGKTVIFEGEAIGDLMQRGNFAWLNVTESGNAIGAWLPGALASQIKFVGGYNKKGDWIKVEGIFNRACLEHGGDLDIHANKILILRQGRYIRGRVPETKKRLSIYLGGITLCLLMSQLYKHRQERKLKTA